MAVRTAAQALAWARSQVGVRRDGGYCLRFVRTAYGIAGREGSAREAWRLAKYKHPGRDLSRAPNGAILFVDHPRSVYGHVAVYEGNGRMVTTNSATGLIHSDPIAKWEGWGYALLGWTEDLNGTRTRARSKPVAPKKTVVTQKAKVATKTAAAQKSGPSRTVLRRGASGPAVARYQREMNRVFPRYSRLKPDGSYGPLTEGVQREFQRRAAIKITGRVEPRDRTALARHGVRLA